MKSYRYKSKKRLTIYDKRIFVMAGISILVAFIIIVRLFIVQVIKGGAYSETAINMHSIYADLEPERGEIFVYEHGSNKKYPVATNITTYRVYIEPSKVQNKIKMATLLSETLELDEMDLKTLLFKDDPYEPIANNVSEEVVEKIKSYGLKGVGFENQIKRVYPERGFGGQILGFVGFNKSGLSGKYGLEGYFDKELSGRAGYIKAQKDATGKLIPMTDQKSQSALDGSDLYLTIDRGIQFFICNKIAEAMERYDADSGSIIVMDPESGKILGMCSYPNYDSNLYNKVKDQSVFNNPAIFDQYEPGSIMKPITMAAGIDAKVVSPESTYIDMGSVYIKPYTIKNSDEKSYGKQTMTEVLEKSLNTGVIYVAKLLEPKLFREYMEKFGFGDLTGVELDSEVGGDVSSLKKRGEIWSATASFGQGVAVTPIQMLNAFNVIANGGKLMRPYIVDRIVDGDGIIKEMLPKPISQVISSRTSTLLRGMLASVVENGHASRASVPGYFVGGKTGTAQVSSKEGGYKTDSIIVSFVGFAPVDNPRFSMIVKIDNPKNVEWASSSAAPIFSEVSRFILNYYKVPPEW